MSVCGITTFNPDLKRLEANFNAILPQVGSVLVWDNGSDNYKEVIALAASLSDKIHIATEGSNKGVAYALNRLCAYALERDERDILLLDQDSEACENMYSNLIRYRTDNVANVSPIISDINVRVDTSDLPEKEVCLLPITSGSLTNLDAWKAIGGFDEKLFIDLVDTEYDIRALMKGYCSYRINTVVLTHEIGHIEPSGLPFPRIQQGKIVIRRGHRSGHSVFRTYYQIRNLLYVREKYGSFLKRMHIQLQSPQSAIVHTLVFDPNRIQRVRAILKAIRDSRTLFNKF